MFRGYLKYSQNIFFLLLQFGTIEMANETMLIQPPDDEHTSHTVTKMAADLSAYADYIVNMTGVTSCINVSLTRFHGVIAFQSSQLWLIRIWVELFCVSYIKSTAVNDVCPLSDAMLRHVVVNISSYTYWLIFRDVRGAKPTLRVIASRWIAI